jgi:formylglycine-generating enzyme required for sulfatase activity
MGTNPARFKKAKSPVERVSWNNCQAFIHRLNQKFGKPDAKFSLPTEAQWEYACRAGTSTRWSFGDDKASVDQYAWWDENSGNVTHPVGQKKPNAWGLYDMHGNVWEWCADWYGEQYYKQSPLSDPTGPTNGTSRVLRGGCFRFENPKNFRSAFRYMDYPDRTNDHHGVRVARTLTL